MSPESNLTPDDDIRQALDSANATPEPSTNISRDPLSDVIATESRCPVAKARYALMKCGLMAEKYPLQTTVLLLISVGCGKLCEYFGLSVLCALILYAVSTEE